MAQLTPGAVAKLAAGITGEPVTLQVLGIKRLQNTQVQQDRFRVLLSDGEHSQSCMLATQLGDLVHSEQLKEGSIVTLHDYISNTVNNKNVIIVLNLMVEQTDAEKIGNPQMYDRLQGDNGGAAAGPPMQQNGPLPQQQYGGPPPQYNAGGGGYGAPPPGNNYGGPPPNQGANHYGPPGGAGGGGYNAGGGGYGAPPPSGPYGAPPQQQHQAPPANPYGQPGPQYRGNGPVARNEAPSHIMPINALNNYQNRWTIKARVTQKSDVRRYSNARGEGRFFSFDLLDAQGGEIRAVAWNEQCDRFLNSVEQGKVYMISKASLRNKRGNFNQTRHQFEIHLENQSIVEQCSDEDDIPQIFFNFSKIATVEDTPPGNVVDVIGVVESVSDWVTITKKDGTETQKRSLVIRDDSSRSIEMTLWGKYANEPGDQLQAAVQNGAHPVLAIKNARVGDFNGKTLSTVASSTVAVDPLDVQEAVQLRQWYDSGGSAMAVEALSRQGGGARSDRRITLAQIKEEGLGLGERPDWVQVSGAVTYLRTENMFYPACPNKLPDGRACNKKLQDSGDGTWFCERCQGSFEPEFRYIINLTLADHTGEQWVTAFQEQGVEIMGKSAGEVREMRETLGDSDFSTFMQDLNFRHYVMKLKVHYEMYQDEQKLRATAVTVHPPNYVQEGKTLIDMIRKLERCEPVFAPPQQQQQQQYGGGGPGYGAGAGSGWQGQQQQQYKQATPPRQGGYGGGGGGYGGGGYGGPPGGGYGGGGYGGPPGGGGFGQQQQGGGHGGYGGGGAPAGGGYGGGGGW